MQTERTLSGIASPLLRRHLSAAAAHEVNSHRYTLPFSMLDLSFQHSNARSFDPVESSGNRHSPSIYWWLS